MKAKIVALGLAAVALAACGPSGSGTGLSGATRDAFVASAVRSCSAKVQMDPTNTGISPAVVEQYCTCYSNHMADTISASELQTIDDQMRSDPAKAQAMMQSRIDAAVAACRPGGPPPPVPPIGSPGPAPAPMTTPAPMPAPMAAPGAEPPKGQ